METTQLILQFGGFGVMAVFFGCILKWLLSYTSELSRIQKEQAERFAKAAEKFDETVRNHMAHETEILGELRDEIKRKT
ncbi:MAG: hypothetical protein M0P29_13555 [Sphaerochaetaceae bacterium]|nr:hypothetical protein [Sphaerochaetaceae bacterium]